MCELTCFVSYYYYYYHHHKYILFPVIKNTLVLFRKKCVAAVREELQRQDGSLRGRAKKSESSTIQHRYITVIRAVCRLWVATARHFAIFLIEYNNVPICFNEQNKF